MSASHHRDVAGRWRLRLAFCLLLGFLSPALAPPARAGLTVDTLVLDLADPKATRRDLTLGNNGGETLYVEVQTAEILAGPDGEREMRQGSPDQLGLLATPNRLILEPGQRRLVRVVTLNRSHDAERTYRITLKPVAGELQVATSAPPGAKGAHIKVLVGYEALVLVRPLAIREQLLATRDGRRLRFENAGNVSLRLDSGRQCATEATPPESCDQLPGHWLRPGSRWELALGHDTPVGYVVEGPSGRQSKSY